MENGLRGGEGGGGDDDDVTDDDFPSLVWKVEMQEQTDTETTEEEEICCCLCSYSLPFPQNTSLSPTTYPSRIYDAKRCKKLMQNGINMFLG